MSMVRGSCLCGVVVWETPALDLVTHCHCTRCRKTHGTAFATFGMCGADGFRPRAGRDAIVRYESSPGFVRPFCGRCGGAVPDGTPWQGLVGVPVGALDDDPGGRPVANIFVASKAAWFEPGPALPSFDAYPPGFDAPVLDELPATSATGGGLGGSCLCGGVAFVVEGPLRFARNCHCSRCRKARAAAHASNLVTTADGVRVTRGEPLLTTYKLPEARFFTQVFCRTCGAPMPRVDRDRDLGIIPMGSLDGTPALRPQRHIFVASKAPWYDIPDDLPQDAEYPPAGS